MPPPELAGREDLVDRVRLHAADRALQPLADLTGDTYLSRPTFALRSDSPIPKEPDPMTNRRLLILAAATAALLAGPAAGDATAQSVAHRHIGHVADAWNGTPDNVGLLPAAQAEAEVAAQHAGLAAAAGDLAGIQRHTTHVLHALDASTSERGPGKGFGLIAAASGCAQHIGMAGDADDASGAVKTHATHVGTSCRNVVGWAESIVEKAAAVAAATDMAAAKALADEIAALTQAILSGMDADGNGRVSWGEGEGGLEQAATHLRLMKEAEGLG